MPSCKGAVVGGQVQDGLKNDPNHWGGVMPPQWFMWQDPANGCHSWIRAPFVTARAGLSPPPIRAYNGGRLAAVRRNTMRKFGAYGPACTPARRARRCLTGYTRLCWESLSPQAGCAASGNVACAA
ncbi:MAG TPA: hypothetical protein PKH77_24955, partial [Anaerolineae bacterium]|nr:hypothetical protein [Anaerolineae bacterium]